MRAYRLGVNLKLGLILFAVAIAVASLWYTNRLEDRLREREQTIVELWAAALAQVPKTQQQALNPYQAELRALETWLRSAEAQQADLSAEEREAFRRAVVWAEGMPPTGELSFIMDRFLVPNAFDIPAIVTDSAGAQPQIWRNLAEVPDTLGLMRGPDSLAASRRLSARLAEMRGGYPPIPIELDFGDAQLRQLIYYGESNLVKELRLFPYVQLIFVSLFILVGYLGFSYVRRSEQSNLWVGMAKEAAHQLGTPISSLMGWTELLRIDELPEAQRGEALDEIDKDIQRLRRVANRFSDIGSLPKLKPQRLAPVIGSTADYIRRRMPQQGKQVSLEVDVPGDLAAPLNGELFEWVIENLLKNALDAIETKTGRIEVVARREDPWVVIDVRDTGKGIERREWKNVFRPGFSTKKRGWGLGLSLAKRIVEDYHGGTLTLNQSRVGQGTTFRIQLPSA